MTLDEIKIAQSQPTDFSKLDASLNEDSRANDTMRYAHDDKLFVSFYKRPMMNAFKSEKEGRPIFEEHVCIRIMIPGDKLNQIDRPASQMDIERFPKQYAKFMKDEDQVIGTPLEYSGLLDPARVEEMRYFHIRTVEQLASMSDQVAQRFIDGQDLKRRAKDWLERRNSSETIREEMKRELEARDERIAELQKQLIAQVAAAEQKQNAQVRKGS